MFERLEISGGAEHVVQHLLLDLNHQPFKQREGFFFVLNQRVFLPNGHPVSPLAQSVHGVQMILPLTINGIEDDVTLEFTGPILMFALHFLLIQRAHPCHNKLGTGRGVARLELRLLLAQTNRESDVHPVQQGVMINHSGFARRG